MFSRRPISRQSRGRIGSLAGGGVTRLWTGFATPPIRAWQSDFGQTLGGTPKATGTAPPAVTISGSAAAPVAFRLEIQTTGARGASTFRYSADAGATFIESNVTTAATYNLIGALAGIQVQFPAGTYTNDNVYQGTVSSWTDQITGTATAAQATAGKQPVAKIGLNGHVSYLGDGVDDNLFDGSLTLSAPGTTPAFYLVGLKQVAWASGTAIIGTGTSVGAIAILTGAATPSLAQYDGITANSNNGAAVGSWVRGEAFFNNNTTDYLKLGATSVTGTNAGNIAPQAGIDLFSGAGGGFANAELMFFFIFTTKPTGTELSNFSTLLTSFYGGSMGV